MKISINARRLHGPWGGGNRFVTHLEDYLLAQGHQVVRNLTSNIDLILLVAAQPKLEITSYSPAEAAAYQRVNPGTAIVLRANTCDEQRGTAGGINALVSEASRLADHTVFVSAYLRNLYRHAGLDHTIKCSVIRTEADRKIFHPQGGTMWRPGIPLRLVTHHWSNSLMKGFDTYERIDELLADPQISKQFEFTFIGRLPFGMHLPHSRVLGVMDGKPLADELRQHHVHLTGARSEPGGNHYIEAMQCGLPVMYLTSGGTPEYCADFGLAFSPTNLELVLQSLPQHYSRLREELLRQQAGIQPQTSMPAQYEQLFRQIVSARRQQRHVIRFSDALAGRIHLATAALKRAIRSNRRFPRPQAG